MKIIPAIDLIDGQCVRLSKGDYSTKKVYNENPLEVAKQFEDHGITHLHLVDLDGAKARRIINHNILQEIATRTNLIVDFGGGLKTDEDLHIAFNSGANQVTGGSIAVQNPELFKQWIQQFGNDKIILGADCRDGNIATTGWTETSDLSVIPFIQSYQSEGIQTVICTDISKDGMLSGPSEQLYTEIINTTTVQLIASGGISCKDDLIKMKEIGCAGTILGKAIYEGRISLKELSELC